MCYGFFHLKVHPLPYEDGFGIIRINMKCAHKVYVMPQKVDTHMTINLFSELHTWPQEELCM